MKQVIVMRTDLNMRKGKMVAQGAHAAVMAFLGEVSEESLRKWIEQNGMVKVCVGVESEPSLLALIEQARVAKVPVFPVHDAGRTEFHGEVTLTCAAFGPADNNQIDVITGKLKLL